MSFINTVLLFNNLLYIEFPLLFCRFLLSLHCVRCCVPYRNESETYSIFQKLTLLIGEIAYVHKALLQVSFEGHLVLLELFRRRQSFEEELILELSFKEWVEFGYLDI